METAASRLGRKSEEHVTNTWSKVANQNSSHGHAADTEEGAHGDGG